MFPGGPKALLALCFLGLTACAGAKGNCGGGAQTQSLARSKPADMNLTPKMLGGFLNITLDGQPLKRCAAHIEVSSIGGSTTRFLLWTARHCATERFKDARRVSLDIFLDGAYVKDLEIKDDYLTRRSEAIAAAEAAGFHAASKKALTDAFDVYLGTQAKREDAGCSNEDLANEASEKGLHSVCANWWDLGVYDVSLAVPLQSGPVFDKLYRAKFAFEAARDAALAKLLNGSLAKARPDQWRLDFIDAWRFQRHKTSASLVKWVEENCDARKPDSQVPQEACQDRDALVELADRYLEENGTSVVELADRFGYVTAGKFKTPANAKSFVEQLKLEEGERVIRIEERWRAYGRDLLFTSKNLHLNTNVTESKASEVTPSYLSMPLSSLASSGLTLKFVTHGFEYVADKEKVAVQFLPGDSGTIFALEGIWPLIALSGVDGAQSSGGASVTALPARRKATAGETGTSANDNRRGKQETASANEGCQALL